MLKRFRLRVCLLLLVAASFGASTTMYADEPFAAKLEREMPRLLAKYGVPGSVVASIQAGAVAWTQAYGTANLATGELMRADMVMEFGSCGKVLTAWAIMRLVEEGKLDLDAPANQYLKRWQIESTEFDANEVTVRRLLSHTSGLSLHGFLDYSPRRAALPNLVEVLSGTHGFEALSDTLSGEYPFRSTLALVAKPGSAYKYSGGGYAVLQMVIEDVAGGSFDLFFQREIGDPLGAASLRWVWSHELQARAPIPYGAQRVPHEYRQLAAHAIGSEIATTADFARIVAAVVRGPSGEPAGRGVLKPETVAAMLQAQPATNGAHGLGYGIWNLDGNLAVAHSGANTGWTALFVLDTVSREGFVIASNSSLGGPLHDTVRDYWFDIHYTPHSRPIYPPSNEWDWLARAWLALAALLALALALSLVWFVRQICARRRERTPHLHARDLFSALPWLVMLAFVWYWLYAPLPLYLPAALPDLWALPQTGFVMALLLAWTAFSVVTAWFPKRRAVGRSRQQARVVASKFA